ncbi:MAG: aspartate aminotransferase family protein [Xanthomonadaceae bacterium]|nr:aspartate aminotransferase family protein [Xanthomonadaceae bacterium]
MSIQDPLLNVYQRFPFTLERGEGMYVYDTTGKKYLDFASGIAVQALGHSHPSVVREISEQAAKLSHVSNLYWTAPMRKLAETLIENSFAERVFFCNSGTEANEAAIKFARKKILKSGATDKHKIISFKGGFHGRTLGALSITEKAKYREPFEPLIPEVEFLEFNSMSSVLFGINKQTAAVFLEPIQGEGGIIPANPEFLKSVRELCTQHGALLVFDEVQCGLGRTGKLWAHEWSGVTPDMMTLAKPLGGGLPCGAVLITDEVAESMDYGDHGSTFGANPIVAAAGVAVLTEVLKPGFLSRVTEMGDMLSSQLNDLQASFPSIIKEIRGAGLMIGVEMNIKVAPLIKQLAEQGILCISSGENVLRLLPPLITEKMHIDEFMAAFTQALKEMKNSA